MISHRFVLRQAQGVIDGLQSAGRRRAVLPLSDVPSGRRRDDDRAGAAAARRRRDRRALQRLALLARGADAAGHGVRFHGRDPDHALEAAALARRPRSQGAAGLGRAAAGMGRRSSRRASAAAWSNSTDRPRSAASSTRRRTNRAARARAASRWVPGRCGWSTSRASRLPVGTPGELVVRSLEPSVLMDGYWGMPQATLEAFRDQWFHTGDVLTQDADGWLYFVGRRKDFVRRRGENISAAEVEMEIELHPEVLECAVVGVPSELTEEEVMACVVLRRGQLAVAEGPGRLVREPHGALHGAALHPGPARPAPKPRPTRSRNSGCATRAPRAPGTATIHPATARGRNLMNYVNLTTEGPVSIVTLNRPERLNAIGLELLAGPAPGADRCAGRSADPRHRAHRRRPGVLRGRRPEGVRPAIGQQRQRGRHLRPHPADHPRHHVRAQAGDRRGARLRRRRRLRMGAQLRHGGGRGQPGGASSPRWRSAISSPAASPICCPRRWAISARWN